MSSIFVNNHIELRPFEDDTLDEIVVTDANGEGFFHLEQMDDNCFWARFSSTKLLPLEKDVVLHFWATSRGGASRLELTYELEDNAREGRPRAEPDPDGLLKILLNRMIRDFGRESVKRVLSTMEPTQ